MVGLGFINGANAPTEEAKSALPVGIQPQQERTEKNGDFPLTNHLSYKRRAAFILVRLIYLSL
jgi:hypothetical protein